MDDKKVKIVVTDGKETVEVPAGEDKRAAGVLATLLSLVTGWKVTAEDADDG